MQLARELFGLEGDAGSAAAEAQEGDETPAEVRELRRRPPR
jgi:hypothetical protein